MNKSTILKSAHALAKQVIKTGDNYSVTFAACLKLVYAKYKQSAIKLSIAALNVADKIATIVSSVALPDSSKRQPFNDDSSELRLIIEGLSLNYAERVKLYRLGMMPTVYDGMALPQRTNWQSVTEYSDYLSFIKSLLVANGFTITIC